MTEEGALIPGLGFLAIGGVFLYRGLRDFKSKRAIAGSPRVDVADLSPGPVELAGTAEPSGPLADPVFKKPCVYYRIEVEERRGSGRGAEWVCIHRAESEAPLVLADGTGKVSILPKGAQWHWKAPGVESSPGGAEHVARFLKTVPKQVDRPRHVNAIIVRKGDPLYVLGCALPGPEKGSPASVGANPNGLFALSDESRRDLLAGVDDRSYPLLVWGPVLCAGVGVYVAALAGKMCGLLGQVPAFARLLAALSIVAVFARLAFAGGGWKKQDEAQDPRQLALAAGLTAAMLLSCCGLIVLEPFLFPRQALERQGIRLGDLGREDEVAGFLRRLAWAKEIVLSTFPWGGSRLVAVKFIADNVQQPFLCSDEKCAAALRPAAARALRDCERSYASKSELAGEDLAVYGLLEIRARELRAAGLL